jgi:hypothetical protein
MAQRKSLSAEERNSLRQAKLMGVALSAGELDDLYSDGGNDRPGTDQPGRATDKPGADVTDKVVGRDGKLSMDRLLAALLGALGIDVDTTTGGDFKQALCEAAMREINKLTGKGQAAGKAGNGANQLARDQNPLIPSSDGTIDPIMLTASIDHTAHSNAALRSSLAHLPIPRPLTAAEEDAVAELLAKMMGCQPSQGQGVSASLSQEEEEARGFVERVADLGRGR